MLIVTKYNQLTERVKNPNWQEADQLAMYKHSQLIELES